ncbi:MAG: DJ-1/PfpI family protein [Clostridium sp.]
MNKILVFVFQGMTDYEITFVNHLLNTSGNKEIVTIAYEKKPVKGRSGFEILPSRLISEINTLEVEGLIIPGGWYGEFTTELLEFIRNLNAEGKLLGGICGAGTVALAKAEILKNGKYTTPATEWTSDHEKVFGDKDPFPRENFINQRVVRDKNVITAVGTGFVEFAVEICDWFKLFESEEEKKSFLKEVRGI